MIFEVFSNQNDSMTTCQLKSQRQLQISDVFWILVIQKTSPGLQMQSEVLARLQQRRQGKKTSWNNESLRKTLAEVIQFCRCCWDVGSAGLNRDGLLGHMCTNWIRVQKKLFSNANLLSIHILESCTTHWHTAVRHRKCLEGFFPLHRLHRGLHRLSK